MRNGVDLQWKDERENAFHLTWIFCIIRPYIKKSLHLNNALRGTGRHCMINEQEVLKIVVHRLESAGIRYMVTGSIGANFYTIPRMTRDIDIIIEVEKETVEKLFSVFSDDFYLDRDVMKHAIQSKGMFNIIHREGVVKVDFIVRKDSEYRRVEFERRRSIEFEGLRILVASPEDLILSKLDWAKDSRSEMQIRDVKNLLQTPGLDQRYILEWVAKLGLQEIYQEANR